MTGLYIYLQTVLKPQKRFRVWKDRSSMAAVNRIVITSFLTILTIRSVSSGEVYVQRGSDITDCSLTCYNKEDILNVYRQCGDIPERQLLELQCDNMSPDNRYGPRLLLNTSSGCWTLKDVRKDDSCTYIVWYHSHSQSVRHSTSTITVLDPVLISTITSNSSRLGQDIAVRVQFSGEETAVTWEVDGGPLPDRYRLIDDNRTLLIPSAQRDDDRRRLSVQITNPVSEETGEYQLEITGLRSWSFLALPLVLVILMSALICLYLRKKKKCGDKKRKMESGDVEMNGH